MFLKTISMTKKIFSNHGALLNVPKKNFTRHGLGLLLRTKSWVINGNFSTNRQSLSVKNSFLNTVHIFVVQKKIVFNKNFTQNNYIVIKNIFLVFQTTLILLIIFKTTPKIPKTKLNTTLFPVARITVPSGNFLYKSFPFDITRVPSGYFLVQYPLTIVLFGYILVHLNGVKSNLLIQKHFSNVQNDKLFICCGLFLHLSRQAFVGIHFSVLG